MQLVIVEVIVDNSGGDVAEGLAEVTEGVKVIAYRSDASEQHTEHLGHSLVMGELFAS